MMARAPASRRHVRERTGGVTLVEVLVVLVVIALLAGAVILGTGSVSASRLRGAAATVVALSRTASTRANSTGRPVRMVFDLSSRQISLEESRSSRVLRGGSDETGGGGRGDRESNVRASADLQAELFLEGTANKKPEFVAVEGLEIAGDSVGKGVELGAGIEYRQVHVEHDQEPRSEGKAYLYFWPGGETEWASIQLRPSGDHTGLTILISPLTGRARIERGYVELPERQSDGTLSEREES